MASSNLENIFQSTIQAPTAEVVREEVILTKEANLENLIYSMVQYASYNHQLYAQAHLIHLNIETPIFISIHGFLKDQYKQHIKDFDTIGELIRSMDFLMPMCQSGLIDAYKKFKAVKSYEAQDKQRDVLEDQLWDIANELKDLTSERSQLYTDMESEAGEMGTEWSDEDANRYGGELNAIEDRIDALKTKRKQIEDRLSY